MEFEKLRKQNIKRQLEWPGSEKATLEFRTIEVAGEAGEVCEAVKKYLRSTHGIKGTTMDVNDIADEIGDTIIALDLLASHLNIDLGEAVKTKFNKTSKKYDLQTLIE